MSSPAQEVDERAPLISDSEILGNGSAISQRSINSRIAIDTSLTFVFILLIVGSFYLFTNTHIGSPHDAALSVLSRTPVIDGHIDLPELFRVQFANNISAVNLHDRIPGHVDIPRLRAGKVGGFFWSVYVSCPPVDDAPDFITPSYRVRDTLEQIDVAKLLIQKYPRTFQLTYGSKDAKEAIYNRKIASWLGVEGGHQLGNSLATLRQYYDLGVRYMTLTHSCHNAFADSCGILEAPEPLHGGLSPFGRILIKEMNRLGMLVDLSHTADATARQALELSEAPVIWSHSSARAVHDVPRNVPDDILKLLGKKDGQKDGVVMVNFAPYFVAPPGKATVQTVANHIDHIAKIAGKRHVGIGSDYDGIGQTPIGLEDASQYPNLFAELWSRGWRAEDLAGLAGANLLRVFEGAEAVSRRLRETESPAMEIYSKRPDLPYANSDEL